jgi:methylmalonyl-CoA mutase N-terminal domain/subunit
MYRSRPWTMRQYSGMGDAEQSNQRYKFLLAQGGEGLSVAFDLPTQIGYDSDSPWAAGEVGKAGVAIDSIEDMERLFAGIPLATISTSMTINATANILLALYVVAARRSGAAWEQLSGTVQNDILKEYIARGAYIFPLTSGMRMVADLFSWAGQHLPKWNPISIYGYHSIEQEARAYLERVDDLGGMVSAIERGWVQREIEDAAYRHQQAVDAGKTVVVGVNRFTSPQADFPCQPDQDVDESAERRQIERLRALRARRDPLRWQAALDRVTEQARSAGKLMPTIIEAVESYATVGEIAGSLRKEFGEYQQPG